MIFQSLKKNTLSEDVIVNLLTMIRENKLRPGDKLPPERELAEMMSISRPSLREALRALAIMNIVEVRQGDGTRVTSLEPGLLLEHLDFIFSITPSTLIEVYEARKIIEPGVAALAAERITCTEVKVLRELVAKSEARLASSEDFREADQEFHKQIAQAACNSVVGRMVITLECLSQAGQSRMVEGRQQRECILADHHTIIAALANHDSAAAHQAMAQHLNNVERFVADTAPVESKPARPVRHLPVGSSRLNIADQDLHQLALEQDRIFSYHVRMAIEHRRYQMINVTAWQNFLG